MCGKQVIWTGSRVSSSKLELFIPKKEIDNLYFYYDSLILYIQFTAIQKLKFTYRSFHAKSPPPC